MGFLDDVVSSAGRAAGSIGDAANAMSPATKVARIKAISDFAIQNGYAPERGGLVPPEQSEAFKRDYPDLANEAQDIQTGLATGIASVGVGAMGAANRAAAAAPGTLGEAAAAARRSAQPGPPGMGSSHGSMPSVPQPIPSGVNPNAAPSVNPAASQPSLPGLAPGSSPSALGPANPGPAQGPPMPPVYGPPQPGPVQGPPAPPVLGPPQPGPMQGPPAPASWVAANVPTPGAAPPQGILQQIQAWARANPKVAAAAGIAAVGAAGLYAAGGNKPDATASPTATPAGPSPAEVSAAAEKADSDARRKRESDDQAALTEQQAALAKSQHEELDRRIATMDLTDSEKEKLHANLQAMLDAQNNVARASVVAAQEAGANSRTAATEAGATARTTATIAGEARNTDARIASDARNTDVRETGENTRSGYQGQVQQRGQDVTDRGNRLTYVVQQAANRVAQGTLSANKAHQMIADYIAREKLPSDILKNVSDAITPMLPYMRNDPPGTVPAGFEKGGSYDQLAKMAGIKGHRERAGYSDFNLMDLAAKYGGGAPTQPSQPIDVAGLYAQGPDMSSAAEAAATQQDAATAGAGATPQIQMPAMMQATPPMDPAAEQRIYNGIK